jgi:hypothetical protein
VEPHGLKPVAPPHASKGGTLRSIPHYAPNELRGVPPLAFTHGLKARGFLRSRVKEEKWEIEILKIYNPLIRPFYSILLFFLVGEPLIY